MKVILLKNNNIDEDKQKIIENIKDSFFVVDTDTYLYQYIELLGLSDKNMQKLKICKEIKNLDVEFRSEYSKEKINSMSELLGVIDMSVPCLIVVMGDNTTDEDKKRKVNIQLSDIIQQFMYINLPLDIIQVMTEKEAYDIEKIKKFEANINIHEKTLLDSIDKVEQYRLNTGNYKTRIMESLNKIKEYIKEAKNNELKIAVAASKKSGKSVIVNSIIGYELAPTSLELATPNNCIYHVSKDDTYTLQFGKENHTYTNPEDMKKYIYSCFKQAESDSKNGYSIPDMEIGYVDNKNAFTSYTIYDTPGPDLAGATGHKEAAQNAVNETDVIIFTIDYSKYLTDSEFSYLKYIKDICKNKKKRYSLIINVNKLDLRYNSSEKDKNVVRILDFIKQKLIKIGPEFSDSMVIGTSALTYFNSIAAPGLKYCEKLQSVTGVSFADNLKECIDTYLDNETDGNEMDILNQIDQTVSNARRFHGKTLENLEDIRNFSGMPNLLSYIKYIATNKARNEKLNSLIFKIDREYKNIQNLFHFQELEEEMMKDQKKLHTARKILKRFIEEVENIFDPEYNDIYYYKKAGGKLKSDILKMLAQKHPIHIHEIYEQFKEKTEKDINLQGMITNYVKNQIPEIINDKLKQEYSKSKDYRKDYKGGEKLPVVKISEISKIYTSVINNTIITKDIEKHLNYQIINVTSDYDKECEKIKYDLVSTANRRQEKLKDVIEEYKAQLGEQCDLSFDIKAPSFRYDFEVAKKEHKFQKNVKIDEIFQFYFERRKENNIVYNQNMNELNKQHGFVPAVQKAFESLLHRKEEYIFESSAKNIYHDVDIGLIIGAVINSDEIKKAFEETKQKINKNVKDFTDVIEKEMTANINSSLKIAEDTKKVLDRTEEYENNIERLSEEKNVLHALKERISSFSALWNYGEEN